MVSLIPHIFLILCDVIHKNGTQTHSLVLSEQLPGADNSIYASAVKDASLLKQYGQGAWTFQEVAFDVLKLGISLIGVKLAYDDKCCDAHHAKRCGKARGFKCGQVVVNPIRRGRKATPFYLDADDIVYYVAKGPAELLRVAASSHGDTETQDESTRWAWFWLA